MQDITQGVPFVPLTSIIFVSSWVFWVTQLLEHILYLFLLGQWILLVLPNYGLVEFIDVGVTIFIIDWYSLDSQVLEPEILRFSLAQALEIL